MTDVEPNDPPGGVLRRTGALVARLYGGTYEVRLAHGAFYVRGRTLLAAVGHTADIEPESPIPPFEALDLDCRICYDVLADYPGFRAALAEHRYVRRIHRAYRRRVLARRKRL